ncbi:dipeptide epimerase [Novosphingobium tardum]|uniref:Dipeptide epimerase n=1 Tax=Novosphingobium tardum TaxID=1538021 RepID=A0ABV8RM80_9SPHN
MPGYRRESGSPQSTEAMRFTAWVERFPVAGAFTIARGAKTHVDVVVCEASDGVHVGEGEGTPIYYRGETAADCVAQIEGWSASGGHDDRRRLLDEMAPGAARNALDCALWALQSQRKGRSLASLASLPEPGPVATAFTVSLATPPDMAAAASEAQSGGFTLLKAKLAGDGLDRARIAAVRAAAPRTRLVIDANESWAPDQVLAEASALASLGVELIEQPLPAGRDGSLAGIGAPVPFCADESCHVAADLPVIGTRYQAVNVKLDKAGGLTAALDLARAARSAGLDVMLGCMLSSSRAVRFAQILTGLARWVDLDGPALLAADVLNPLRYEGGMLWPD